ncbi:MAG: flagellar biosynthetic protein FliO [Thiohalomonadaceae bacterium]
MRVWLSATLWVWPTYAADIGRPTPAPVEAVGAANLLQVLLALVLVLLLIVGMAWLMRRMGGLTQVGGGVVRVLGGVPVGQRERVVLIQVGNKQLLLGVAPGRVQTLHVLDEPISVTTAPGGNDSFAERLTAALKKSGRS